MRNTFIHPDGYRAETRLTKNGVGIIVTRLQWPPERKESFEVKDTSDVLPFLIDGFGTGWKPSKTTNPPDETAR